MAGKPIDDLAVVISASTEQLANDLGRAGKMFRDWSKAVEQARPPGVMDVVTKSADRFAGVAREALRNITSVQGAAAAPFKFVAAAAAAAGTAIQTAFRGVGGQAAAAPLHALAGGFGLVGRAAGAAAGVVTGFAGRVAGTTANLIDAETGLGSFAGVVNHLKESVRMAGDVEQTTLAFEVMLGSAEKANRMVADLRRFAAETPFGADEVQRAAKQLTGYGITADQIIPTIRMLGDVSSGLSIPLNDLSYLYGTLYTQQRAYAVDIKQFAGRGIEIYEALAKTTGKSAAEVQNLVEQGRIGRDEVTKSFVQMTGAGGRFYKMTERQGQTFKGRWDAMLDAFAQAKARLGGIIIEELGLKTVAGDMSTLAQRMGDGFERLRPTIRAIGDGIKGTVQGLYDFGRAAADAAPTVLRALGMGGLADHFRAIVDDAGKFFSDPERVSGLASDIAAPFLMAFAHIRKAAQDLGQWLDDNVVRPFREFQAAFGGGPGPGPKGVPRGFNQNPLNLRDALDFQYAPPYAEESPAAFRDRFGGLEREMSALIVRAGGNPAAGGYADLYTRARGAAFAARTPPDLRQDLLDAADRYRRMLGGFDVPTDQAAREAIFAAKYPPFREGFQRPQPLRGGPLDPVQEMRAAIEDVRAGARAMAAERKAREAEAEAARKAAEAAEAAAREWELAARAFGGNPLVAGREAARRYQEGLAAAAVGGVPLAAARQAVTGVRTQGDIPPNLTDMAAQLRKEYSPITDPMSDFAVWRRDLEEIRARGLIGRDIYNRALVDRVEKEAQRAGVGGPYQLPDAVAVGTAEAARLVNRWRAGGEGRQTVEQLLERILRAEEEQIRLARLKAGLAGGARPTVDFAGFEIGGP